MYVSFSINISSSFHYNLPAHIACWIFRVPQLKRLNTRSLLVGFSHTHWTPRASQDYTAAPSSCSPSASSSSHSAMRVASAYSGCTPLRPLSLAEWLLQAALYPWLLRSPCQGLVSSFLLCALMTAYGTTTFCVLCPWPQATLPHTSPSQPLVQLILPSLTYYSLGASCYHHILGILPTVAFLPRTRRPSQLNSSIRWLSKLPRV